MSNVSAVSYASTASTATTSSSSGNLGQDEFLKLLITQLQYQDPMNPMEDKDFIAQLAQFSTLEKTMSMSSGIESLTKSQTASQAVAMIGKSIDYLDSSGNSASGKVSGVTLTDGVATLKVGSVTVSMGNVLSVYLSS
jgi:flagellar basal-body rod modification protein FlgD